MFQIKICGITDPRDALAAAEAGADALGLNFYKKSPRGITLDVARRILSALPRELVKVGVFVNAPAGEVVETFDRLELDLIQLHGDESPAFLPELDGRPVIRAFRLSAGGLSPVVAYLAECEQIGVKPVMVLLDAHRPGQYGGTGETADWATCAEYVKRPGLPPFILAGGLTPLNVAQAVRAVRPDAVDTASGVECSPGRKDPDVVRAFVQAARNALTS
ncbi:MAG: phosphoribosylanthranilate isomerase [Pirellulales bacterium]|nr:phosphoribosylanthranilate isomerase [Pirellulales bacterium]